MDIERLYRLFLQHPSISTDSRQVVPGSLFFALRGESFNGNRYAADALKKGAVAAVVDDPSLEDLPGMILTGDSLKTLQELAHMHRLRSRVKVLAITGTNGKTTTKELVAAVLSGKYRTLFTKGNLNNHIGVPITLLSITNEELAVIEMGANHPGEIALLAEIADPDIGLITNIGKAHLEGFGSLEGVMAAKGELYDFLEEKEVPALVNVSNPLLLKMVGDRDLEVVPYSTGSGDGPTGKVLSADPYITCEVSIDGVRYLIPTRLIGAYNLENVLAAVAAGLWFRVPLEQIIEAISTYAPENKRSQLIAGKLNTIILDAYNANPTSMAGALNDFFSRTEEPKMVILGDMLELGASGEEEHGKIVGILKEHMNCRVCLVGPLFSKAADGEKEWQVFPDTQSCLDYLMAAVPEGFHVLIKGSRKMALEETTKCL